MKLHHRPPTEAIASALGWRDQRARRTRSWIPGDLEEAYADGRRLAARMESEGARRAHHRAIDRRESDLSRGGDAKSRNGANVAAATTKHSFTTTMLDPASAVECPAAEAFSRFVEIGSGPLARWRQVILFEDRAGSAAAVLSESEACTQGSAVRRAIASNASRRELGSVDPFLPVSGRIDDVKRRCGSGDPVYPQSPEARRDDAGRLAQAFNGGDHGMSPKRKRIITAKKARKALYKPDHSGVGNSKYARKCRGDYPPNSPYRTIWAHCCV